MDENAIERNRSKKQSVLHLQETVTFSALSVSVLRLNAFFRISQDSAFIFFLFTSSDRGTLFGTGGEADLM